MKNNTPSIVLSRTSPRILRETFEQEVPKFLTALSPSKKNCQNSGRAVAEPNTVELDPKLDNVGVNGF